MWRRARTERYKRATDALQQCYSPAFLGVSDPRNCRSAGRLLFHVSMSVRSEWSSSSLVRLRPAGLCRPNKWLSAALFCFLSPPPPLGRHYGLGPRHYERE